MISPGFAHAAAGLSQIGGASEAVILICQYGLIVIESESNLSFANVGGIIQSDTVDRVTLCGRWSE